MAAARSKAADRPTAKERSFDQEDGRLVAEAVRRAQRGEREAIGLLYARYADDVQGYVRSILRDRHEAEDVTQQVFAKLITAITKYEQREVPFFAWILRVARNVALDHIRARRTVPVGRVRLSETDSCGPVGARPVDELREVLADLPRDQREVLVLRHVAGLSPREIAACTGRTEASIHGLHHRGRRTLQAGLLSRDLGPAVTRTTMRGA
jgi:RNA polymerase sigma-70 factor (ECF subfamily)